MKMNRRELIKLGGVSAASIALAGGGAQLAFAERKRPGIADISGNENPFGPAPAVSEALHDTIDVTNRYGFAQERELRRQIAEKEGVSVDHIVIGTGSTEMLNATTLAYTGPDKHVIVADQSYSAVPAYARNIGREVIEVPLDNELRFDLEAMSVKATNGTGLVYVVNPNNPTGTVVDSAKLRDFISSLPPGAIALVDEAYLEFTDDFDHRTMLDLVKKDMNVVVARTFSKIHGLAGMRIGYAVARPDIAARLTAYRQCRFMGPLCAVAASVSLRQIEFQDFCRAKAKEGRELTFDLCKKLGLQYAQGAGNFVFFNPGMKHAEFKQKMADKGVNTARPFPPRPDWARVTMGTSEEMQQFARVLPEVLGG
jgi:histidinol-phosphate aminotransferase